jgi:ornithine cyclodeaminase/alanine dehydrogenase
MLSIDRLVSEASAMRTMLYLSGADVLRCEIAPRLVLDAVEAAFRQKADGGARTLSARALPCLDAQGRFHVKGGLTRNYAALKWYGYFDEDTGKARHGFAPLIVLNDAQTGEPLAVMDGGWATAMRTAAISAVAAKYLARRSARRIGFIGCGAQARSHFLLLRSEFDLRHARAYSRGIEGAREFCEWISARGSEAIAVVDPREAVLEMDIVVTSVPYLATREGFLDAAWLSPGAFVAMVDRGCSWRRETMAAIDLVATDDLDLGMPSGSFNLDREPTLDLARIVAGAAEMPGSEICRKALAFSGTGLADLAVAQLIYSTAIEKGLGTALPV